MALKRARYWKEECQQNSRRYQRTNAYVLVQVLDGALEEVASVLGPVRPARELINQLIRQVDIFGLR
jgi:hypothetical protein